MTAESGAPKPGWLEIVGEPERGSVVYCPPRDLSVPLRVCLACKDCAGLAMDGSGQRSFLVCTEVEARCSEREARCDEVPDARP